MAYPELPWILKGEGPLIGGLFLSKIDRLSSILPRDTRPISVLKGKTIGAFYYCKFGLGSEIEYHEFFIMPALVTCRGKRGFWGQVMYVDNPDATVGIFEKSGIPKLLASFRHDRDEQRISIAKNGAEICSITYGLRSFRMPSGRRTLYGFGKTDEIKYAKGVMTGSFGPARVQVDFSDSDKDALDASYIDSRFLGFYLDDFDAELFYPLKI